MSAGAGSAPISKALGNRPGGNGKAVGVMAMADPTRLNPQPGSPFSETDDEIFANIRRIVREEAAAANEPTPPDARPARGGEDKAFLPIDRIAAPSVAGEEAPLLLTERVGGGIAAKSQPIAGERAAGPADAGDAVATSAYGYGAATMATRAAPPLDNTVGAVAERLRRRQRAQGGALTGRETVSERSLDRLVEEMLRPMVQEWLDRHLERIVREQTDRTLRAALDARGDDG